MSIRRLSKSLLITIMLVAPLLSFVETGAETPSPGNGYFLRTWERTDVPVVTGDAVRTWMWGPAYTELTWEPYAEGVDGRRPVQYFDKSRMEITYPDDDPNSIWYVTNGLLVNEMITGEVQFGDSTFEEREPAVVNVAGDGDDPNGPTYASFAEALGPAPDLGDALITERIDRAGNITLFPDAAFQNIRLSYYDDITQHNIAAPFWDFMNSQGLIVDGGAFTVAPLFLDPFFATGRPISEPYWAVVRVAGIPNNVLIQCFERRCLTYTPDNAPEWRVEAGNVGLHYHLWRYGKPDSELAWLREGEIWTMTATGGNVRSLTTPATSESDSTPAWSPDGEQLAFTRTIDDGGTLRTNVYLINRDGSGLQKFTTGESAAPYWSPDGTQIAFRGPIGDTIFIKDLDSPVQQQVTSGSGFDTVRGWSADGSRLLVERVFPDESPVRHEILVVDIENGNAAVNLTPDDGSATMPRWSPDESQIIYVSSRASEPGSSATDVWIMKSDGSNQRRLTNGEAPESWPAWSPDGAEIAYVNDASGAGDIWAMSADGSDFRPLALHPGDDIRPIWSTDGGEIYFMSDREAQYDLYVMNADGAHARRLTSDPRGDSEPELSPRIIEPF